MYEISSNVPIPENRNKYPFREMSAEDSFLVPGDGLSLQEAKELKQRVLSAASQFRRRYLPSGKFVVRLMNDSDEGGKGVRCWRVK